MSELAFSRNRRRNNVRYIDPKKTEVKISTFGSLHLYNKARLIDTSVSGFMCALDTKFQKITYRKGGIITMVITLGDKECQVHGKILNIFARDIDKDKVEQYSSDVGEDEKDEDDNQMICLGISTITDSMIQNDKNRWLNFLDRLRDKGNEARWYS